MARMAIDVYPTRPARFGYGWLIASGLLIAVYLLIYLFIPDRFSTFAGTYAVAPLLWFLLLGVVIFLSRRARSDRAYIQSVILVGLVLGVFQIACLIIAGMIAGFGQSPYSHSVKDIFLNLLVWVPPLIALEFTRSYLLRPFSRRHTALMLALTTLLFAFIMVPLSRYSTLDEYERFLPFAGGTGLPLLAENMLAGVLVLLGGPWAAIAYRGALEAYQWFSPILPDLAWIVTAFVGTLAPVAGYLALQSLYGREFDAQAAKPEAEASKNSSMAGWAVTGLIAVALLFVSLGLVGFRPVTIVSGSMSPAIEVGDLAIIREVSVDDIDVGDVIQYKTAGSTTVHRVVQVRPQNPPVFITKGDANARPDSQPVPGDEVIGRVQFCVPKVGWVPLEIKRLITRVINLF